MARMRIVCVYPPQVTVTGYHLGINDLRGTAVTVVTVPGYAGTKKPPGGGLAVAVTGYRPASSSIRVNCSPWASVSTLDPSSKLALIRYSSTAPAKASCKLE